MTNHQRLVNGIHFRIFDCDKSPRMVATGEELSELINAVRREEIVKKNLINTTVLSNGYQMRKFSAFDVSIVTKYRRE